MQNRGQFAVALTAALEDRGRDMLWLATQINKSYEHVRKLCRSLAFPSQRLLKEICRALELTEEDMWRLVITDKIEQKYGTSLPMAPGKSRRAVEIERLLPRLSDQQFRDLVGMARVWALRNNRRAKR
jgi:hypothetical protein